MGQDNGWDAQAGIELHEARQTISTLRAQLASSERRNGYLEAEAKKAGEYRERCEALTAHVEDAAGIMHRLVESPAHIDGEAPPAVRTYLDWYSSKPETSLARRDARLKAQWQAEALEEAVELYGHPWKDAFAEVVVNIMRKGRGYIYPEGLIERADELRRQAERGE